MSEGMSTAIQIKNLNKTFKTKLKGEGLVSSLQAVFRPSYKYIPAVKNVSLEINQGELVAFIGPNGAGKSTTLKMLSGILTPDSGNIKVLGLDPQKDRKKLAYHIGTVFGQKPQLWFHLPAIDSFKLFSKIYELDDQFYNKRIQKLIKLFDIEEIVQQPVRKLSLGQRMRCEFVLALIHKPKVIFLDEPTIGLDVSVKKTVRELIKTINSEEKVSIILTSHDMGDIEHLCKRVIIINEGELIYDGDLQKIKEEFMSSKIIKIQTENRIKIPREKGLSVLEKNKFSATIEVDTNSCNLKKVIDQLMKENQINDILIQEQAIEEIIDSIYHHKK